MKKLRDNVKLAKNATAKAEAKLKFVKAVRRATPTAKR